MRKLQGVVELAEIAEIAEADDPNAHKIFITETEKRPLKSTFPSALLLAVSVISCINSLISSIIWFSMDVFPKPKSRRWRTVNRRCCCHKGPWLNINPKQLQSILFINFIKFARVWKKYLTLSKRLSWNVTRPCLCRAVSRLLSWEDCRWSAPYRYD